MTDQALAEAVQPARWSVSSSVERGTLNVRHTEALLTPAPSGGDLLDLLRAKRRWTAATSAVTLCGREPGDDVLSGQGPLILGECAEQREQQIAVRGVGVHRFGQ